jgi:hypothetical protein
MVPRAFDFEWFGRAVGGSRLGCDHPVHLRVSDVAAQAHQSTEDSQRNKDALPSYYADRALDPVITPEDRRRIPEAGAVARR